MEVLLFRGVPKMAFELSYSAKEYDTPYIVEECKLRDSRVCAKFAVYDDALDFIEDQIGELV
jgi:hypothetical protein